MVTSMAQGRRSAAQQRNRLARLVVINIQRLSPDTQEDAAAIANLWFAFIEFAPIEDVTTVHGQVGDILVAAMRLIRAEDPTAWADLVAASKLDSIP